MIRSEWNEEVRLTTLPAVRKALETGAPLPGNLIVASDPSNWYELRDLCAAHSVQQSLTFACPLAPHELGPTLAVWWRSPKKAPRPQRLKLEIHQMAAIPGPEPRPPNQVVIKRQSASEQCTLRLSAPSEFRYSFSNQNSQDTPARLVAEWAKMLDIKITPLTGGSWQTVQDSGGTILVGYLRVPKSIAERCVACSGRRALFATIITREPGEKIKWFPRDRNVPPEDFFRYCQAQAVTQNKPLVFRQGGGKNLGILGAEDSEADTRLRNWVLHGSPKSWDQSDVTAFLKDNDWRSIQVFTRRKSWTKGAPPEWLFRAFVPVGAEGHSHFAYADDSSYLTVFPEGPHSRKKKKVTPVLGLKKRWVDPISTEEDAPTGHFLPRNGRLSLTTPTLTRSV